ncbi:very short patch repair endonuclease [Cryobacterium sp. TMT2-23]|uniref:very short patch repair endonuclease n=1 Tax=Cryobacterium sp. TMT2-23 TaxID=1259252 RepID=UPI00106B226A|nr:very short patch repair endonuclease [Cryobacterium sp. TMT2-23]TFD23803.1 DNA mismatch endonuclease Vsr [Cryobacterium sp. TMT2-23]
MVDVLTPQQRRLNMSRIRSADTKPEMVVRRRLHALGYRYRLHVRDLPGSPDLVFPRRKRVVFVNGCFWHMHSCRFGQVKPATNSEFWEQKRLATVARDARNRADLVASGWGVMTVWECQLRDLGAVEDSLVRFLR